MTAEEKHEAERHARHAVAAAPRGVVSPDACPYPSGSDAALHWLVIVLWCGAVVR